MSVVGGWGGVGGGGLAFWLLDGENQAALKMGKAEGVGGRGEWGVKCCCRLAERGTDVEARRRQRKGRGGGLGICGTVRGEGREEKKT